MDTVLTISPSDIRSPPPSASPSPYPPDGHRLAPISGPSFSGEDEAEYAVVFAPRTHKFETINFRGTSTIDPPRKDERSHFAALFISLLFIGPVAALCAFFIDQLIRFITLAIYRLTTLNSSFGVGFLVFVLMSMLSAAIAALLVLFVAPVASGSGIPELKACLNGVRIPGFLRLKTLVTKLVGISFAIASGLIVGKQGPMIHIGAILGAGLSLGAGRAWSLRLGGGRGKWMSWWGMFRTQAWKRDFVAVGAALGAAVAFGSPLGAWIWIYEEACTHWNWQLAVISLGGCLSGVFFMGFLTSFANSYTFLFTDLPEEQLRNSLKNLRDLTLTQFGKVTQRSKELEIAYPLKDFPGYVALAILGGIVGAILPWASRRVTLWRYSKVVSRRRRFIEVMVFALVTAAFRFGISWAANRCGPVPEDLYLSLAPRQELNFAPYLCKNITTDPEEAFSPWATLLFNPLDSSARAILYVSQVHAFSAPSLLVAFAFYFVLMTLSFGLAVPSGIFFPGFLIGATMGRLVGVIVALIFPNRRDISVEGYAFLGAVAALGGITRDVSVAVIALEATGGFQASYAAAIVVLIAKLVGDRLFNKGIYDLHIDLKGMPYLAEKIPHPEAYHQVRVRHISSNNLVGLGRRTRVDHLLKLLSRYKHHAFPVFRRINGAYWDQNTSDVIHPSHTSRSDSEELVLAMPSSGGRNTPETWSEHQQRRSPNGHRSSLVIPVSPKTMENVTDQLAKEIEGAVRSPGSDDPNDSPIDTQGSLTTGSIDNFRNALHNKGSVRITIVDSNGQDAVSLGNHYRSAGDSPGLSLEGMIERHTLLCLLEAATDDGTLASAVERDGEKMNARGLINVGAEGELKVIPRDKLDLAWPNSEHLKNESKVLRKARAAGADDVIIDLKDYLDPNPLVINDDAVASEAYNLFRSSGGRHILAINLKKGSMSGMITRKDILPRFILDASKKLKFR